MGKFSVVVSEKSKSPSARFSVVQMRSFGCISLSKSCLALLRHAWNLASIVMVIMI